MRNHRFIPIVVLALAGPATWVCGAGASSRQALPPARLPSRHWSYAELEELSVSGALDSLRVHSRPVSRYEVAAELLKTPAAQRTDPRWARLMREYALEVRDLDSAATPRFTRPALEAREGRGRFRLRPRARAGISKPRSGDWNSRGPTEAGVQAEFVHHPGLAIGVDLTARDYPGSSAWSDPLFTGTEITTLTGQAHASLSLPPGRVTLGRDRVRWGLGQSGALLLGDAAPPMTLLEHSLAWHELRFTAVSASIDAYKGEYLAAHRLEWQASRAWFFAASEAARYPAPRGIEPLYLVGVLPYTIVQRLLLADAYPDSGLVLRNNVMISLEAAWRPARGVQLGATWLADDFKRRSSQPQSRTAWQLNVLLSPPGRRLPWSLRAEWTRVRNYIYASDYGESFILQGNSLGYPLGPDLARVSTQLAVDPCADLRGHLRVDYLAKGEGRLGEALDNLHPDPDLPPAGELKGVVEKDLALALGARWFLRDNLWMESELGPVIERDADHVRGRARTRWEGTLFLEFRW